MHKRSNQDNSLATGAAEPGYLKNTNEKGQSPQSCSGESRQATSTGWFSHPEFLPGLSQRSISATWKRKEEGWKDVSSSERGRHGRAQAFALE